MTSALATQQEIALCRQSIELHSKSFAMASRLLPSRCRDDAAVLYAWCRHADDAIDESPAEEQSTELAKLQENLAAVYCESELSDPVLRAFRDLTRRCSIPVHYPAELLEGMAMDTAAQSYPDMATLVHYCYRVASTVGLMMSHVIGLNRQDALRQAAHMGIGMQLTNVCRDVLEDWQRERLYLPDSLLERHGAGDLRSYLGGPFPIEMQKPVAGAVRELLDVAELYYRSADRGLSALPWRAAFGVRSARLIYSDIGNELRRLGYDVCAGRAVVSKPRKFFLVLRAGIAAIAELPRRWGRVLAQRANYVIPKKRVEFSNDILCQ